MTHSFETMKEHQMRLSVQQTLLSARKYAKNGQLESAKQQYLSILAKFPNNKPAQNGLAALGGLKTTQAIDPPQDRINTVIALYNQGRMREVHEHTNALLRQYPDTLLLHIFSGVASINLGYVDAAIERFNSALRIDPNNVQAHNNLGGALKQKGNLSSAIACYQKALQIEPDNADLHNNLGIALAENGDMSAAQKSYQRALDIVPDNFKFITSLCDFYEKTNDLTGLSDILSKSKNVTAADNANVLYYAALLAFREKAYEQAKAILKQINPDTLIKKRVIAFYELKGKLFDKIGLYADAFEAFSDMNAQAIESPAFKQSNPDDYFVSISSFLTELKNAPKLLPHVDTHTPASNAPSFLVGFPRSGTTLLDTILRSHSQIVVAEEKPMVAAVRHEMGAPYHLSDLENLTPDNRSLLQAQYFAELDKHLDERDTNWLCIDKLPLNALDAPLIEATFPKAKFILAIRHPYDCILSCYMQYFKLNPQMANMVDLKRIVEFYCVVMETWWLSQKRYGLNFHMIRYEDLVVDMPTEVEKLLQFLGLEWEESLTDYQKTALKRGKINTPSYSQVVQPLYKDASYRWKNYQTYFDAHNDQIQPWIKRFGYA